MRAVLALIATALACSPAAALTLTSRDLTPDGAMPIQHVYPRCGGRNVSPDLRWSDAPSGTKSFVLTMIDLDVKPDGWSHWIVVGLPAATTSLAQGVNALPTGARAIVSYFGDPSYDGPCPPAGTGAHHYRFTVWALPTAAFDIASDAPASGVTKRLEAAALAHASLTATAEAP